MTRTTGQAWTKTDWRAKPRVQMPVYADADALHSAEAQLSKYPPLVFAGVWQEWGQGAAVLRSFAIVTTAASPWMAATHHREPVVLAPDDWARWLGETDEKAAPLMRSAPQGYYQRWRVDPKVNSNRAEGPALTQAIAV